MKIQRQLLIAMLVIAALAATLIHWISKSTVQDVMPNVKAEATTYRIDNASTAVLPERGNLAAMGKTTSAPEKKYVWLHEQGSDWVPMPPPSRKGTPEQVWEARLVTAKLALNGDNRAAITMGLEMPHTYVNLTDVDDPLSYPKWAFGDKVMPHGVKADSLYWLQMAAERGSIQAKYLYAMEVNSLPTYNQDKYAQIPPTEREAIESRARQYLQDAIDFGIMDAIYALAMIYKNGSLGIGYDAIRSHVCLIQLARVSTFKSARQALQWSMEALRPGELVQARQLAEQPNACRVI